MDRDDEKQTVEDTKNTWKDEELTVENVDEQVEHHLLQPPSSGAATPLARTVNDLRTIYTEKRSLEQAWARINDHMEAREAGNGVSLIGTAQTPTEALRAMPPVKEKDTGPHPFKAGRRVYRSSRWNWRIVATGLVAAIVLLAVLVWPLVSYALHGTLPFMPSSTSTPRSQSTPQVSGMKEYNGQYFKFQYPSNWVITQDSSGEGYRQTVQLRPSEKSPAFVTINVLSDRTASAEQLLQVDPDMQLGKRLGTSSVTYHGVPWNVGMVEHATSGSDRVARLKVAYSNQGTPYRIEFGALANEFGSYTSVFDAMFASFYAQPALVARATATPESTPAPAPTSVATSTPVTDSTPPAAATATSVPTVGGGIGLKVYSDQYFQLQYPSSWVITQVSSGGSYQETVQLRPAASSSVSITINVLANSPLSASQLLQLDPDIKLGTLLSTSSASYHGVSWNIGIANILDSVLQPPHKVEVAYTNQTTPYKVELSAPLDTFDANTQTFNNVLASFNPAN
ncbi:PsbP-related protein [Dictyobacter aurantiacus]|uniref:Uncharacterized protein n=1 Tax=Dictyobacter aurantiacus TaxID=1936993 RepID=A0A401ZGR7_9CHLR|nr:PsbP-related protein [Dictyobacter aurantiacus]GCE06080.1 hypothetical protein KDAU_34090 [Dictyobacter aurantiacus]